jgi:hypothetical protein
VKVAGLAVLLASSLFAGTQPRVIYTRSFPGSSPEYFRICVEVGGDLEYSESIKDENPLHAHLQESEAASLFDLAGKLSDFKTPLESGLKVANTGKKVFRYEDGKGGSSESTFNYSVKPAAQQLLDKFEAIAATERAYLDLDRTVHFDKLGVNDALAEIEVLWMRKQLAAPEQFVPLLTRVATHDSFMHLARERAARMKDEFTKPVADVNASNSK